MKIIIKRDNRTLIQTVFSRETFRFTHIALGTLALIWVYWQVVGRSAGFIDITQWETDNQLKAVALMMAKVLGAFAIAATSRDIRDWWGDYIKYLSSIFFG